MALMVLAVVGSVFVNLVNYVPWWQTGDSCNRNDGLDGGSGVGASGGILRLLGKVNWGIL